MYAGIDIGGTNIKGVLTDKSGKELSFKSIPTPKNSNDIDDAIAKLVEILSTSASVSKIDIKAIGIGSAGAIDRSTGTVITSPNIPAWKNHPIVKNIEKKTGARVILENDATAALVGAWWKDCGSKFRNWVMITLGTGIGGGVIIDGKMYTGQSGSSMEIGHTTIDFKGKECACGNTGCLERYASASALVEYVNANISKNRASSLNNLLKHGELTARMIFEEAEKKDEFSIKAFEELATYLGIGVVNIVNIFNPEAVIFAGGLSNAHRLIFPAMKKIVKKKALPGLKDNVQFLTVKDNDKIASLGAAKIAIDSYPNCQ